VAPLTGLDLGGLRGLSGGEPLPPGVAEALARPEAFPRLHSLALSHKHYSDSPPRTPGDVITAVLQPGRFNLLEELTLDEPGIGSLAAALDGAAGPALARLTLRRPDFRGSDNPGAELAGSLSRHNRRIRSLRVLEPAGGRGLGAEALQVLVGDLPLAELAVVGPHLGKGMSPELARALTQSPAMTSLDLSGNLLGDDGVVALAAAWVAAGGKDAVLATLRLERVGVGPAGTRALAEAMAGGGALAGLEVLALGGNASVGDEGLGALAEAVAGGAGACLRVLGLEAVGASGKGVVMLVQALKAGAAPRLGKVNFAGNREVGKAELAAMEGVLKGRRGEE
jgi:hypothetical protein